MKTEMSTPASFGPAAEAGRRTLGSPLVWVEEESWACWGAGPLVVPGDPPLHATRDNAGTQRRPASNPENEQTFSP